MPQQNTTLIGVTPETLRSYLLILAESLNASVAPALEGHTGSVADECAMIATRLAHTMDDVLGRKY